MHDKNCMRYLHIIFHFRIPKNFKNIHLVPHFCLSLYIHSTKSETDGKNAKISRSLFKGGHLSIISITVKRQSPTLRHYHLNNLYRESWESTPAPQTVHIFRHLTQATKLFLLVHFSTNQVQNVYMKKLYRLCSLVRYPHRESKGTQEQWHGKSVVFLTVHFGTKLLLYFERFYELKI